MTPNEEHAAKADAVKAAAKALDDDGALTPIERAYLVGVAYGIRYADEDVPPLASRSEIES